jgi:hypothetical protein
MEQQAFTPRTDEEIIARIDYLRATNQDYGRVAALVLAARLPWHRVPADLVQTKELAENDVNKPRDHDSLMGEIKMFSPRVWAHYWKFHPQSMYGAMCNCEALVWLMGDDLGPLVATDYGVVKQNLTKFTKHYGTFNEKYADEAFVEAVLSGKAPAPSGLHKLIEALAGKATPAAGVGIPIGDNCIAFDTRNMSPELAAELQRITANGRIEADDLSPELLEQLEKATGLPKEVFAAVRVENALSALGIEEPQPSTLH